MQPSFARLCVCSLAAAAALSAPPAQAWDNFDDLFDYGRGETGILWIGGDYKLSSGDYKSETAVLGSEIWHTAGTVWQTGGAWTVTDRLQLGSSSGLIGTYTLDGGTLSTNSTAVAISNGWATFTQNAGLHFIAGELGVGGTNCCRGASHGDYNMAGGSIVGGNLRVGAASAFTQSAGTAHFSSGGTVQANGSLVLRAGQLSTGGTIEVERLGSTTARGTMSFSGGLMLGNLAVDGELAVEAGELRGSLDNRLYGVTNIHGNFSSSGGISNRGTVTISSNSRVVLEGAGVNNQVGGVFTQSGRVEGNGAWNNLGQMNLSGEFMGTGNMLNSGSVTVDRGLVLTRSGTLSSSGSWTNSASGLTLGSGAQLVNSGTMLLDRSHVGGSGSFTNDVAGQLISRGNGSLGANAFNRGRYTVEAGTFALGAGLSNDGTLVMQAAGSGLTGATITNRGSITGQGRIDNGITQRALLRAEGGTLALHGALNLQDTSRIEVAAGSTLHVAAAGNLRLVGTALLEAGTPGQAPAILRVAGTLNQDGTLTGTGRLEAAQISNAGTLRFGDGISTVGGTLDLRNTGRVELTGDSQLRFENAVTMRSSSLLTIGNGASASFASALTLEPGARLAGTGAVQIESLLDIGSAAMTLQYDGLVLFAAGSRYRAQIGATTNDRLAAAAGIGFDGTLSIELLPGFSAQAGQHFQLFDSSQFGGAFSQIDTQAAALPAGLVWDVSALASQGVLGVSAVPEPQAWALMLGGLLAIGLSGRVNRARRETGTRATISET